MIRVVLGVLVAASLLPGSWGTGTAEPRPSEEEIGPVQVYLTPDQALREIFGAVAVVDTIVAVLRGPESVAPDRNARPDTIRVFVPRALEGTRLGYALIGEEIGKYRPITFMVGLTPELEVRDVEILVDRESRGGEVRRTRFLRQYRGKGAEDPIRTNRDILNIAGATLSVQALNAGVKRCLLTLEALAARGVLDHVPAGAGERGSK